MRDSLPNPPADVHLQMDLDDLRALAHGGAHGGEPDDDAESDSG